MKIQYNMLQDKSQTYSFLLPLLLLLASSLPGQSMDNVIDGGYLKNWLLAGPFPMKTFDASLPFSLQSISTAPPIQGMTIQYNQSRKATWESFSTLSSFINLNSFYGKNEDCHAIAYCTVTAPREGLYNLFIGQDDMLAVWLNGESVYLSNIDQSLALDKNVIQCWMEQGKNQLLLKSGQGKGFWNFSLRFQESSQNFQPVLSITSDATNTDVWGAFWKYNYGDNPQWASPDYDDSHWATSPSWEFQPDTNTSSATKSLWIRFQIAFPEQEEHHAYLLSMLPGDIHIFQDGRLTHKNDTNIPFIIQFPGFQSPNSWLIHPVRGQTSTIAIQSKNQHNLKMQIHDFMDYHVRFSQYLQYHTLILILFTAIPFCLLLFHISIHVFYPGEKYNIIYSLYLISFTAYVLINLQYDNPYIYYDDSSRFHFFKHFIIWPNVFLFFATLYSLFNEKIPRFFYALMIVLGCLCTFQWYYARTDYLLWYGILFLAVVETFRLFVRQTRNQFRGIHILWIGIFFLLLGSLGTVYQLPPHYTFCPFLEDCGYFLGMLSFTLSLSVYSAYRYTLINKEYLHLTINLEKQVRHRTEELKKTNLQLEKEITVRKQKEGELERLSYQDALTGIANRRNFDERFMHEWKRAQREDIPLSLMMCDVDFFKNFNDTYGHQAGDNCLRLVAKTLSAFAKRPGDFVARYGGEEFAILLFGTKAQYAQGIAEAMNEAVSNLNITHASSSVHSVVTISIGLCDIIPTAEFEPKDLVNKADQALYQAKKTGRNRIVVNQWVP